MYWGNLVVLQSCRKEDESKTEDNRKFFEKQREIIVKETFEFGSVSSSLDSDSYVITNHPMLLQVGVCATIENGYLNIGCVEPLIPPFEGTNHWRTFEPIGNDTVYNFKSSYPIVIQNLLAKNIGVQIDFVIGGITEFRIGKFFVSNTLHPEDLNGKSLHVKLTTESGEVEAYLNDLDVSDLFITEIKNEESNEIIFRANAFIEEINGQKLLNLNGLRIDLIEIYNV